MKFVIHLLGITCGVVGFRGYARFHTLAWWAQWLRSEVKLSNQQERNLWWFSPNSCATSCFNCDSLKLLKSFESSPNEITSSVFQTGGRSESAVSASSLVWCISCLYTKNVPLGTLFLWEAGGICRCKNRHFSWIYKQFWRFFVEIRVKSIWNRKLFVNLQHVFVRDTRHIGNELAFAISSCLRNVENLKITGSVLVIIYGVVQKLTKWSLEPTPWSEIVYI